MWIRSEDTGFQSCSQILFFEKAPWIQIRLLGDPEGLENRVKRHSKGNCILFQDKK